MPAPATFAGPSVYSVGDGAQATSAAAGDFNHDGKLDLIVTAQPPFDGEPIAPLSQLLGRGDGTFAPATPLATTTDASLVSVRSADLNADGRPDLILVGSNSDIQVALGNGDGTFAAAATYYAGTASVAIGDLNGDGRPDLVTQGGVGASVGVLINRGDGSFNDEVQYPVGPDAADTTNTWGVAVADFTGDGKADVAVTIGPADRNAPGHVRLLAGTGSGTLRPASGGPAVDLNFGGASIAGGRDLVPFNFDADGKADLAVLTADDRVAVFRGGSAGLFSAGPVLGPFAGGVSIAYGDLAAADLNRDGRDDLVAFDGNSGSAAVLLSQRIGGFRPPTVYPAAPGLFSSEPAAVAVGDFNRDGLIDLAVASGRVTILGGGPAGTLRSLPAYDAGLRPNEVVVGDFNGDHIPDVAASSDQPANVLAFLPGTGGGRFDKPAVYRGPGDGTIVRVVVGDFNGDQVSDVATLLETGDVVLRLGGSSGLSSATVYPGLQASSIGVGDFNGDGRSDLAVLDRSTVTLFVAGAGGKLAAWQSYPIGDTTTHHAVAVGDFDGDGKFDLALVPDGNFGIVGTTEVRLGRGDGTLGAAVRSPGGFAGMPIVGDFDRDGLSDLAGPAAAGVGVGVLLGRRGGALRATVPSATPPPPNEYQVAGAVVAAADFNLDGLLDLATADGTVMLGRGDGTFAQSGLLLPAGPAAAADLNADGRPDLVAPDLPGQAVRLLLNTTNGPNLPPARHTSLVPDPTFGDGGLAVTSFHASRIDTTDVALALPDGKVLVAGLTADADSNAALPALARLNPDGTADASFGSGGRVTVDQGATAAGPVTAVARQADGKILAAWEADGRTNVARYTADGRVDVTFGEAGRASVVGLSTAIGLAVMPSGQILLGTVLFEPSYGDSPDFQEFGLARFTAAGKLDGSFGTGGVAVDGIGPSGYGGPIDGHSPTGSPGGLVIQPDGRVLIAYGTFVARYRADGHRDSGFGTDGVLQPPAPSTSNDWADAIALQPDGKIVVAGLDAVPDEEFNFHYAVAVRRYTPAGRPDPSFGRGGQFTETATADEFADAVLVQRDGKIVVGGSDLFRLNADGTRDRAFTARLPDAGFGIGGLTARPDGRFFAVGSATVDAARLSDFALAAYRSDGSADPAFGRQGRGAVDFDLAVRSEASAVAVGADGKVVAAGVFGPGYRLGAVRYTLDGRPDATFGEGGRATAELGVGQYATVTGVAVQADGKVVVTGSVTIGEGHTALFVARFTRDGRVDVTFGSGGRVVTGFGPGSSATTAALAIQPDGKILVAGAADLHAGTDQSDSDFALVRYTAAGRLDGSFGTGGKVMTGIGGGTSSDAATAMVLLPDGRIVLAGQAEPQATDHTVRLARYTPLGRLDSSFGHGGKVTADLGDAGSPEEFGIDAGTALNRSADGRLVVVATSKGVVRLTAFRPDGTQDASFGGASAAAAEVPGGARGVFRTGDGKLLVVVTARDSAMGRVAVVARYNADGTPDLTFGTGGRVVTEDDATTAAVQADGRLLLAGRTPDAQFLVARYSPAS